MDIIFIVLGMTLNCTKDSVSKLRLLFCYNLPLLFMLPSLFSLVIDVLAESFRENSMHEILYADDLVLLSDTMSGLKEKFRWKNVFEKKGLKINISKIKVFISGVVQENQKSKVDPCGVCCKSDG